MLATNIGLAGALFAVILKTDNKELKEYSLSAFITAMLGTSQPGIYGVAMKYKNVLIGSMIGGFIGGFFGGISNFKAYAYVNPGLPALPIYMSPDGDPSNLIKAFIIMAIAFVTAFIYVYNTRLVEN